MWRVGRKHLKEFMMQSYERKLIYEIIRFFLTVSRAHKAIQIGIIII